MSCLALFQDLAKAGPSLSTSAEGAGNSLSSISLAGMMMRPNDYHKGDTTHLSCRNATNVFSSSQSSSSSSEIVPGSSSCSSSMSDNRFSAKASKTLNGSSRES